MANKHKIKIAIRVDASSKIGTGHVIRCLTLANELKRKGALAAFVCREHSGNLYDLIEYHGFEVLRLGIGNNEPGQCPDGQSQPAHLPWLETDQYTDAEQSTEALQTGAPWDWLIVDHYAIDHRWETSMRQVANKIMVIDDIADRKHDCDLLLDQNYFQELGRRYYGLIPEHCETLLGPKYALLRAEFREARKFCRMRGNGVARVLVYFGGNDPDNLTGMALEALSSPELEHLLVEAVIAPNNKHQEQLEQQAKNRPGTRLHIQPKNFTELMLRADLCIGAGGTTTWERLCLGLPSLVITVAQNQVPFTRELDEAGYVRWLENKEQVTVSDIRKSLTSEIHKQQDQKKNPDLPSLVDGYGVLRAAEYLVPSDAKDLSLRRAVQEDMEFFFFWANDPAVRKNSFSQEPISWAEHMDWFKKKINSPWTGMWVMQTPYELPVGQIRFDIDQEVVDINYSLDLIARGRKWGVKLLELGINKIRESAKGKMIQGRVKKSNPASRRIFLNLGFTEAIENDVFIFRKRIL